MRIVSLVGTNSTWSDLVYKFIIIKYLEDLSLSALAAGIKVVD
jgi:hypothetical protein